VLAFVLAKTKCAVFALAFFQYAAQRSTANAVLIEFAGLLVAGLSIII